MQTGTLAATLPALPSLVLSCDVSHTVLSEPMEQQQHLHLCTAAQSSTAMSRAGLYDSA